MPRWWQALHLVVCVFLTTRELKCVWVCAYHEALCACVYKLRGGVGEPVRSGPGRHQHSIIPDLPDDTSRENTLPTLCRLAFVSCLLFIIFRAALPRGQVTICILFLQVFSKTVWSFCISPPPPTPQLKGSCWWVLIPTWVPLQMTLLAWCQKETNREPRCTLD